MLQVQLQAEETRRQQVGMRRAVEPVDRLQTVAMIPALPVMLELQVRSEPQLK